MVQSVLAQLFAVIPTSHWIRRLPSIPIRPVLLGAMVFVMTAVSTGMVNPGVGIALDTNQAAWVAGLNYVQCPYSAFGVPQTITEQSRGGCVAFMQRFLNRWNMPKYTGNQIDQDGVFGTKTDKQVRDFQDFARFFKLSDSPTDGVVGPQTWGAVYKCLDAQLEPTCHRF